MTIISDTSPIAISKFPKKYFTNLKLQNNLINPTPLIIINPTPSYH